ncbi:MAG: hypothetical protein ABIU10_00675 [Sphingomicrobium sp.]
MPDFPTSGSGRDPTATAVVGATQDSAALLLIESLIHGLIARSILSVHEAIDIVDIAADVEREIHDARKLPTLAFQSLLAPLSRSLRVELNR